MRTIDPVDVIDQSLMSDQNAVSEMNSSVLGALTGREKTRIVARDEFESLARRKSIDSDGCVTHKTIFVVKPILVPVVKKKTTRIEDQWNIYHQMLENPHKARRTGNRMP